MNNNDKLIEALKKYFPERIFERIKREPEKEMIEGERKHVSILFGDLTGFTSLTEKLEEPEEISRIINRYFTRMLEIIKKYGGDLDKLIGDAIMVLFGAPVSHKDDPLRAVEAALEMVEAIKELGSIETPRGDVSINMSIGINTGEVVALNVGSKDRMEYTVMGDEVNLSSRLEGIAEPGEVIISESTFNEVKNEIVCEELQPVMVKGKEKPVQIYRALKKKEKEIEGKVKLPFTDREEEFSLLNEKIEDAKKDKSDSIVIYGPFGIGKTELIKNVINEAEGIRIIHLKGKKFRPDIPYYPITDWMDVEYGDSPPENLLIFKKETDKESDFIETSHQKWNEYLKNVISVSPLLIWIENWEYLDDHTAGLFSNMEERAGLLLIIESETPVEDFNKIELEELNRDTVKSLCEKALEGEISENFLDFLIEKSDGNPYQIELIIEWLIRNQGYEKIGIKLELSESIKEKHLPAGLTSLMSEKLDSFPENLRTFIKNASVLGDRFTKTDYIQLYQVKDSFFEDITEKSIENGILTKSGKFFHFNSPQLREVAYNSIFKHKRKKLHNELASIIEDRNKDNLDEMASLLSFHYERADNREKAIKFAMKAAERERRYSDFNSSLSHYGKAEELLKDKGEKEELIEILSDKSDVYQRMGRYDRARENIEKAISIAEERDSDKISTLYGILADILRNQGKYEEASDYYDKAIDILEKQEDNEQLAVFYQNSATLHLSLSQYEKALEIYERALELAQDSDRLDVSADIHFNRGHIYDILGDFKKAEEAYNDALDIYKHLENKNGEAKTLMNLGSLYLNDGRLIGAEEKFKECLEISEKIGNIEYRGSSNMNTGIIYVMEGKFNQALELYQKALEDFKEIGSKTNINVTLTNIAEIYELRAELDLAEDNYQKALENAMEIGDPYTEAYIRIKLGRINLWRANFNKAVEELNKALEIAEEIDVTDLKSDSIQFLSRIMLRLGYTEKSRNLLLEIEPEIIANHEVKGRYLITKALIEEETGNYDNALELGENLIKYGRETGAPGIILDGYGILLRTGQLPQEKMEKLIEETGEIIEEKTFIQRNLWIILSLVEYYIEIDDIERANISIDYVLKTAREKKLRLILLEANRLAARINEKDNEPEAVIKRLEEGRDILFSISENLDEERKLQFLRKHIDILQSLLNIYYKKENTSLIISLYKKLPDSLGKELMNRYREDYPEVTENLEGKI